MFYLEFFWSLLKHKWYVVRAGRVLGIPLLRLIVHDWQKYMPVEFGAYARYFFGGKKEEDKPAFMRAWLHHVHRGPHHWEYWLLNPNYNFANAKDGKLPMPEKYVREMVADWLGASRAYTGEWCMVKWMNERLPGILDNMHQETINILYDVLHDLGYVDSGGDGWYCKDHDCHLQFCNSKGERL